MNILIDMSSIRAGDEATYRDRKAESASRGLGNGLCSRPAVQWQMV